MFDLATSVRLLLALVVAVYGFIAALSGSLDRRRVVLAVVGLVPFLVWLIAPQTLDAGELGFPLAVRRLSLIAGGVAIALRYGSVRARGRSERTRAALSTVAAVLALAAITVGSSNWLVAAAAVVSIVATFTAPLATGISPSGASADEDPRRPGDRRETR